MNNFGPMAGTLRKVTEYQQVQCEWMPGYGDDYYRITVEEGAKTLSDVFYMLQ